MMAAMRDCGWFFWFPLAGRFGYEAVPIGGGDADASTPLKIATPATLDSGSPLLRK